MTRTTKGQEKPQEPGINQTPVQAHDDARLPSIPTQVLAAVSDDVRLSIAARAVVLYLAFQDPDGVEVSRAQWQAVMNHASDRTIRDAIKCASEFGYIERVVGGRGHSDTFRLASSATLKVCQQFRVAPSAKLKDRVAPSAKLNGSDTPHLIVKETSVHPIVLVSSIEKEQIKETSPSTSLDPVSTREGNDDDDDDAGRVNPKVNAVLAKNADLFRGCRGAVFDYVKERVPRERQYGWIRTVEALLNGLSPGAFQLANGRAIPTDEKPKALALALNELLATSEADMAATTGDVRNLKTKLYHVCRNWKGYDVPQDPQTIKPVDPTYVTRVSCSQCGASCAVRLNRGEQPDKKHTCGKCSTGTMEPVSIDPLSLIDKLAKAKAI